MSVSDIIRRGFENTVANWPLILIRLAESILLVVLVVVTIVAAVVPVALSIGFNDFDPQNIDDGAELLASIFLEHWPVLLYLIGLMTVVFLVFIAIHSFMEAGCAAVYVAGESRAPIPATRPQFQAFTGELFFRGGRESWWQVFWIYNIAWGVAGLIILVPLIFVAVLMLLVRDSPGALAAIGCGGMALTFLFFLAVAVITAIWCQKAIVVRAAQRAGAAASLGIGWRQFKADAGRHVAVAVIIYAIMMAGIMFFSSLSAVGNFNDTPTFTLALLPIQLAGSFINSIFTAVIQSLFLACFAALTVERPR